jgi:hypothetical protein
MYTIQFALFLVEGNGTFCHIVDIGMVFVVAMTFLHASGWWDRLSTIEQATSHLWSSDHLAALRMVIRSDLVGNAKFKFFQKTLISASLTDETDFLTTAIAFATAFLALAYVFTKL